MKKDDVKIYPLRMSEQELQALARIDLHISKEYPGVKHSIKDLIRISIFHYDEIIRRKHERNKQTY